MLQVVVVAAGGAAGAVARYLISIWAAARFGPDFPYGTLLVNISGCFMIGMVMTVATERVSLQPYWQLLLGVGFIGGSGNAAPDADGSLRAGGGQYRR